MKNKTLPWNMILLGFSLLWAVFYLKFTAPIALLLFVAGGAISLRGMELALPKDNKKLKNIIDTFRLIGFVLAIILVLSLICASIVVIMGLLCIATICVIPMVLLESTYEKRVLKNSS